MVRSHAADWDSELPTPAQLKELFAQIESGRITKDRLQKFLRGSVQSVAVEVALRTMGRNNFFGPEQWRLVFGEKFQLLSIPKIPWTHGELKNPGINQKHFLFLGLECLDGKPLNLLMWQSVFIATDRGDHPKFYRNKYLINRLAQGICANRWYLMPVGVVKGSVGLTYNEQVSLLPDEYEVPSMIELVTANILFYLLNSRYLDDDYWAITCDKEEADFIDYLGIFCSKEGMYIDTRGSPSSTAGIAASRKS